MIVLPSHHGAPLTRFLALILALIVSTPSQAVDLLLRASSQATTSLGLFQLGLKHAATATFPWPAGMSGLGNYPFLQGTTSGGVNWFVVIAGGGSGVLYNAGVAYDSGFWMTMRWNGPYTTGFLPASLVAYTASGLSIVASGAVAGVSVADTFNALPQTPAQPSAAVLATATAIQ